MSKRRQPGEIVKRKPGSGFVGSAEPELVQVPNLPEYKTEAEHCMISCGDPHCTEWANLPVIGPVENNFIFHISECQMEDADT